MCPTPFELFPQTGLNRGNPLTPFAPVQLAELANATALARGTNLTVVEGLLLNSDVQPQGLPTNCTYFPTAGFYDLFNNDSPDPLKQLQQHLQDNWVLAPLAAVGRKVGVPSLVWQVQETPRLYAGNFFHKGSQVTVVVDDQLPFDKNGTLCAAPVFKDAQGFNASWGAISEKLAAKAMDHLPGLTAGNHTQGWQNLRLGDSSVMLRAYGGSAQPFIENACFNTTATQVAAKLNGTSSVRQPEGGTLVNTITPYEMRFAPDYNPVSDSVTRNNYTITPVLRDQLWKITGPNGTEYLGADHSYPVLRTDPAVNRTHTVVHNVWGNSPFLFPNCTIGHGPANAAVSYGAIAAVCNTIAEIPDL